MITVKERINKFLLEARNTSLGYCEIHFFEPASINKRQIGYKIDSNFNSLVSEKEGAWQEEWLVIATQEMGDPIFVDTGSGQLTVLSAWHGEGIWEPFIIADSLENFDNIIQMLHEASKGRTNPVELKNNPIRKAEIKKILTKIKSQNPETRIEYWGIFFENG